MGNKSSKVKRKANTKNTTGNAKIIVPSVNRRRKPSTVVPEEEALDVQDGLTDGNQPQPTGIQYENCRKGKIEERFEVVQNGSGVDG
ncbi:unnamed protein product, partial [Choristocarpus tenellus]